MTVQVNSLVLDNCRCNGFPGKLGKFSALTSLSVVNAGLTSLEGFPPLKSLKEVRLFTTGCGVCYVIVGYYSATVRAPQGNECHSSGTKSTGSTKYVMLQLNLKFPGIHNDKQNR